MKPARGRLNRSQRRVVRLGTDRLRPGGAVERMAFSPDGAKLAAWSSDSHITDALTIWDTKTGRAVRRSICRRGLDQLVWLADGRGIALIRPDYEEWVPLIWEFTDEKATKPEVKPRKQGEGTFVVPANQPVQDHESDSCYAISPDGKVLAIGKAGQLARDREVQLWELKTGVKANALKPLKGGVIHPGNCGAIHFTPDAKLAFTTGWDNTIRWWDTATGTERRVISVPEGVMGGALSPDSKSVLVATDDGKLKVWDAQTGHETPE